jgi:hypothetical protein
MRRRMRETVPGKNKRAELDALREPWVFSIGLGTLGMIRNSIQSRQLLRPPASCEILTALDHDSHSYPTFCTQSSIVGHGAARPTKSFRAAGLVRHGTLYVPHPRRSPLHRRTAVANTASKAEHTRRGFKRRDAHGTCDSSKAGQCDGKVRLASMLLLVSRVRTSDRVYRAELGRAAWKVLHTTFARFPEKPTEEEKEALRSYVHLFQRLYPWYATLSYIYGVVTAECNAHGAN